MSNIGQFLSRFVTADVITEIIIMKVVGIILDEVLLPIYISKFVPDYENMGAEEKRNVMLLLLSLLQEESQLDHELFNNCKMQD